MYQLSRPGNATLRFESPCERQGNGTGEKSCPVGQGSLRHLMLLYKMDEADKDGKGTTCELTYKDPMNVS